jgi:hypothetical protein
MNGLRIILADPDPTGLPAAVWLLKFLLVFTFVLHLFFMNVVLGGGLVWLWANWRARRFGRSGVRPSASSGRGELVEPRSPGSEVMRGRTSDAGHRVEPSTSDLGPRTSDHEVLARAIGRVLPVATAFAITTGVAPLLFTQLLYGQLFYTSSVLMAWPWLAVVGLLLAGYYANYGIFASRPGTLRAVSLGTLSVLLFAAIGFLFTNNMTLMLRPELHAPLYLASDAGLHTNMADTWVWPRFAHMLVGSLAVTGLVVAWIPRIRRGFDPHSAGWVGRYGTRLFMAATLVEFLVGVGFFFALPRPVKDVFLGGRTPDALLVVAGAAFALAAVAIVRRSLLVGSCATIVALADMAVVRHRVRAVLLEPYFQPDSLPVVPQAAVFVLFALVLVAGLVIVAWMIWKFVTAAPARAGEGVAGV